MKIFNISYVDLDGKNRLHNFNAENEYFANLYAERFCNRFGFKLIQVEFLTLH